MCSLALRPRGPRQASGFARRGGPRSRNGLVVALSVAALLGSVPAHAAAPEPVRVDYRAEESCPDADAFLHAVLSLTVRARAAQERVHEPARTFHVLITRDASQRVHGAFSVTDAHDTEQTSSARTVDSDSCQEVFDALTLFAALSVDADLQSGAPDATPAAPTEPPPSAARQRSDSRPAPPATVRHDQLARRLSLVAGLGLGLTSAGTTTRPVVVEGFFETRWQRAIRIGVDVSPTLRATLSLFGGDSDRVDVGYAHLQWTTARLDACPLALTYAATLRLRPCLSFSGGILNAAGREIAQPSSHHLTWWTVGGALRGEWTPNAFGVELTAGFEAPLQRAQLYFEPSSEVYRPPVVFERVTLGAAYHFL